MDGVFTKKSEPTLQKIPTNEMETMMTWQSKQFFWGFWICFASVDFPPTGGVWG